MLNLTVRDIMNPQLVYVDEDESTDVNAVRAKILSFGVSGVPVLDRSYRATGFVSLRDVGSDGTVHVTRPAVTTEPTESVEAAAKKLVDQNLHHLVVVDERGIARGMVSALDFLRAFAGLDPCHPASFDGDADVFGDCDGEDG